MSWLVWLIVVVYVALIVGWESYDRWWWRRHRRIYGDQAGRRPR